MLEILIKMEMPEQAKLVRRRLVRRLLLTVFVLLIGLWCFGAFVLVDDLRAMREYLWPPMLSLFVVLVCSGLYLHNAKCPKCGNRFAVKSSGLYFNDFSGKCVNCGIRLSDTT